MNRQPKNNLALLFLALSLLGVSLACAAAETLINGTPTPVPPTATATELPPTATVTPVPTLNWTPIPCAGDDCIDACMSRVEIIMETSPFQAVENEIYNEAAASFDLVAYPVEDDSTGAMDELWAPKDYKIYKDDLKAHTRIWNYFVAVIPSEMRSWVDRMIIFTDGPSNKLAWVKPTAYESENWTIGFDIVDSEYPPYLTETLVHEVGHLVTLNADQVAYGEKNPVLCKTYLLYEGCSHEDSYMNQFYQRFWPDIYKEWQLIDKAQNGSEYYTMLHNFYSRHSYEFVSEYAASNPVEDMAESWTAFILKPKPTKDYNISDQKVLFFYDFPELVEYRQQIIDGLCSYVQ
jgi:hypothetical protein